jgi:hypothetical protein
MGSLDRAAAIAEQRARSGGSSARIACLVECAGT